MKPTQEQLQQASMERIATEHELAAAIKSFEGEMWRGDPARLSRATEAAHAALQNHLDAITAPLAIAKRMNGA